jgi:hypothetical protein
VTVYVFKYSAQVYGWPSNHCITRQLVMAHQTRH